LLPLFITWIKIPSMKITKELVENLEMIEAVLAQKSKQLQEAIKLIGKDEDCPEDIKEALEECKLKYSKLASDLVILRATHGLFIRR